MDLKRLVREIPDFPKPGILFRDITPLMANPDAWSEVINQLSKTCEKLNPDIIAGIESRGFIIGASIATKNRIGFLPIRKKGKLPGKVIGVNYELEYGSDRLEIIENRFKRNSKILIVDDLLATGGTAKAATDLLKIAGGDIVGYSFIIELRFLNGRRVLGNTVKTESLIVYE